VITLAWQRWKRLGGVRWLIVLALLLALDLLVAPFVVAWELSLIKELLR
jgi:hypothetical protein